jgi:hypothetical protein
MGIPVELLNKVFEAKCILTELYDQMLDRVRKLP